VQLLQDISNALYEYNSEYPGLVAQRLKLDFLKKITNNFSSGKIIGKGGYATVYEVYLIKEDFLSNVSHN
jgi:hypothetical protein